MKSWSLELSGHRHSHPALDIGDIQVLLPVIGFSDSSAKQTINHDGLALRATVNKGGYHPGLLVEIQYRAPRKGHGRDIRYPWGLPVKRPPLLPHLPHRRGIRPRQERLRGALMGSSMGFLALWPSVPAEAV